MNGRPRRALRLGLLICWLSALVVLPPSAAAPREGPSAGERTRTDPSMLLDDRLDALRRELGAIEARLGETAAAIDALSASVLSPSSDAQRAKHVLARETDAAIAASSPSTLAAASAVRTLPALIEPLESVSRAMRSKDAYVATLLKALSVTQRQEETLGDLTGEALLLRSQLEQQMNVLLDLLTDATRASFLHEPSGGGPSWSRLIQTEIGRAHGLLSLVERAEVDLRALSLRTGARGVALVEQLKRAGRTDGVLHDAMIAVEGSVGALYPGLSLTSQIPVIGGVFEICPVDQPHAYSDDFGAPRWSGGYHAHQGNDIFAPEGTPIRAPFDGTAVEAANTLGGRAVTVYGRAGYVYNAHLSAYGTLGEVTTGTVIGYVGNTGDAIHSAPHNHFEWHPGNGPALNPFPYLNAVCLLPDPSA